jgi:hypothetical protein
LQLTNISENDVFIHEIEQKSDKSGHLHLDWWPLPVSAQQGCLSHGDAPAKYYIHESNNVGKQ